MLTHRVPSQAVVGEQGSASFRGGFPYPVLSSSLEGCGCRHSLGEVHMRVIDGRKLYSSLNLFLLPRDLFLNPTAKATSKQLPTCALIPQQPLRGASTCPVTRCLPPATLTPQPWGGSVPQRPHWNPGNQPAMWLADDKVGTAKREGLVCGDQTLQLRPKSGPRACRHSCHRRCGRGRAYDAGTEKAMPGPTREKGRALELGPGLRG